MVEDVAVVVAIGMAVADVEMEDVALGAVAVEIGIIVEDVALGAMAVEIGTIVEDVAVVVALVVAVVVAIGMVVVDVDMEDVASGVVAAGTEDFTASAIGAMKSVIK